MIAEKVNETAARLESIFRAVDQLKMDLVSASVSAETLAGGTILLLDGRIEYKLENENLARRDLNTGATMFFIPGATEFFATYFDEAGSVLYRVAIGKEQVRGYVFLRGLAGKS